MAEKVIGYIVLAFGILIILAAAFNGFQILTKSIQPVRFISVTNSNSNIPLNVNGTTVDIKSSSILDSVGLTGESVNFTINLVFHLMILGFIAKMGFHLASLGTMLVRKIVVDIKTKEYLRNDTEETAHS